MTGEVPQPEIEQVPAIVLYGDAIEGMDEIRRQEIAASLALLLGVKAVARDVNMEYASSDKANEREVSGSADNRNEPSDVIPPFTLLTGGDYSPVWGNKLWDDARLIKAAKRNAPGVIENDVLVKRALSFVRTAGYKGRGDELLFSYHFESNQRFIGSNDLVAITFNDPEAIVSEPERVRDAVRGLGPKTIRALAQFVTAMTHTR